MTVQFKAGSLTVLPKSAQINQPWDADGARQKLLEITRELVNGSSVKSGYLRLHLDKDSPTLSRGGGHVRSGYSAARSLVEQLVHTAYGADSSAAASLRTYLDGRTKIGTRSLVKLVASMEADAAPELAGFRELKNTRLQAPVQRVAPSPQTVQQQRLQQAEDDLERAMLPVPTPRRFISLATRLDKPTAQLDRFKQAMGEIDQARQAQQERLALCRAALAAGAQDPLAQVAQSDAALIERFFNPDHELRDAQHQQIKKGIEDGLNPDQIAKQLNLDTGLVADQMLSIELGERWEKTHSADQAKFVERLLLRASDDPLHPLSPQAQEVEELLTPENLQWYVNLRTVGIASDEVPHIKPPALRQLAEKYTPHDPRLSQDLPADPSEQTARMRQELFEEQAQLITDAGRSAKDPYRLQQDPYRQAWGEARGHWINQAKKTEQARDFLAQWRDTRPAGESGKGSVVEGLIEGRLQEVEQLRQRSIDELLTSIDNQWGERLRSRVDPAQSSSEVLETELQAFETALTVARSALNVFDAAHETAASHRQRLGNLTLLEALSNKVVAARSPAAAFDAKAALADLQKRAKDLSQRREREAPAKLQKELQVVQRDLGDLERRAGSIDAKGLKAVAALREQLRLTQEAIDIRAGRLAGIEEVGADLEFEDDEAQVSPTRAQRTQAPATQTTEPAVAQATAQSTSAKRGADLPNRLAELKRTDPARHAEYLGLAQKLEDANLVDQWLDEKSKSASISPAVLSQLKNGVRQKQELFGQQMQTLLDSESGRLDGRTRLTPAIRAQVLAEDRSQFWAGAQFQPFLDQLLADPVSRQMLDGQDSLQGAIDQLIRKGATVEEARDLINRISVSFTQWQADEVDRAEQVPGAGRGVSLGESVLKRLGAKRIANAGDGHCLFLSFGHFQDPKAAGPDQAGKKSQQELIRRERQGLLDQALRLSEAQYRLMGTDRRSQDLDKAESVERLLIGLNSAVGTDERGWGWVGHFPLKAMQAQRPVLLISEDGQTRAWGPDGQEIKLSASQRSNRSAMGQGQLLLGMAKDKAHNPKGAAPIVVFNRHNHFEAVQVP